LLDGLIPLIERGMSQTIYKILRDTEWPLAASKPQYTGSPDDQRDGFIHFSTANQLQRSITKHFQDEAEVYILAFDISIFPRDHLKWEPSGNGVLFPHLYGTFQTHDVQRAWKIKVPSCGVINFSFLEGHKV